MTCSFHAQGPTQPVQDHSQHVRKTYAHYSITQDPMPFQLSYSSASTKMDPFIT